MMGAARTRHADLGRSSLVWARAHHCPLCGGVLTWGEWGRLTWGDGVCEGQVHTQTNDVWAGVWARSEVCPASTCAASCGIPGVPLPGREHPNVKLCLQEVRARSWGCESRCGCGWGCAAVQRLRAFCTAHGGLARILCKPQSPSPQSSTPGPLIPPENSLEDFLAAAARCGVASAAAHPAPAPATQQLACNAPPSCMRTQHPLPTGYCVRV